MVSGHNSARTHTHTCGSGCHLTPGIWVFLQRFMGLMTRPDLWPTKHGVSSSSLCSSSEERKTHTDILKRWDFNGSHDDVRAFWGDPNIWDNTWKTDNGITKSASVNSLTMCCIYCNCSRGLKAQKDLTFGEFCASVQGDYGRWGLDARFVPQKKNQTKDCPENTSRKKIKLILFPTLHPDVQTLNTKCSASLLMLFWSHGLYTE